MNFIKALAIHGEKLTVLIQLLLIFILFEVLIISEAFLDAIGDQSKLTSVLLPNILSASSIFAGLIATYLVGRIVAIRAERLARLPEIDRLSVKLTLLRKILYHFRSDFFVNRRQFLPIIDANDYRWERISSSVADYNDDMARKFWSEPRYVSDMECFLCINTIVDEYADDLGWAFSKSNELGRRYTYDELVNAYYISNEIWDYFDNNFHDNDMEHRVDFSCHTLRAKFYTDFIFDNVKQIDPEYGKLSIDRHFLSKLGGDFHSIYLPSLIRLVKNNDEPMSPYLLQMIYNLVFISAGGILIPLFTELFKVSEKVVVICSSLSISVISISILFIGLSFKRAWNSESDVSNH